MRGCDPQRHAHAAVARGIRGHAVVAVDREGADEEGREVHLLGVEARHLAVDAPMPERRVAGLAGRALHDQRDLAVADEEQHLPALTHLDVGAGVARLRDARGLQLDPEARVHEAGARQAVQLLEGEDRVEVVLAVVAVDAAERVVEVVQPAVELEDARPAEPGPSDGAKTIRSSTRRAAR